MRLLNRNVEWDVRLHPNEVWRRVESASDSKRPRSFAMAKYAGEQPFFYTVIGSRIIIQKRRRRGNDFQTELKFQIEPARFGSKLKGVFGIPLVSILFFVVFTLLTGSFGVLAIYLNINGKFRDDRTAQILSVAIPFLMFIFGLISLIRGFVSMNDVEQAISKWIEDLFADVMMRKS